MQNHFKHIRAIKIINRCISDLNLNLSGKVVLTEVGSNYYLYTPIIALLAGAKQVIAWSNDSVHGKATDIKQECEYLVEKFNVPGQLIITDKKNVENIKAADIITNSGNLRPLDESFLINVKKSCVIPIMYEAWEIRDSDIDVQFCKQQGIEVAGTWENHPLLKVFDYGGALAVKLSHEAGFEVSGNRIMVWSDDHFGKVAAKAFKLMGAKKVIQTVNLQNLYKNIADIDFIYICNYSEQRSYIGINGMFSVEEIRRLNPSIGIVHLYGEIDFEFAKQNSVHVYPPKNGRAMIMTETLGYVGLEPILRLQTAGFKVAEELISGNISELTQKIEVVNFPKKYW